MRRSSNGTTSSNSFVVDISALIILIDLQRVECEVIIIQNIENRIQLVQLG